MILKRNYIVTQKKKKIVTTMSEIIFTTSWKEVGLKL